MVVCTAPRRKGIEELLETFAILEDEDTRESIREAEEDMKAGRVRDYEE